MSNTFNSVNNLTKSFNLRFYISHSVEFIVRFILFFLWHLNRWIIPFLFAAILLLLVLIAVIADYGWDDAAEHEYNDVRIANCILTVNNRLLYRVFFQSHFWANYWLLDLRLLLYHRFFFLGSVIGDPKGANDHISEWDHVKIILLFRRSMHALDVHFSNLNIF